VPTPEPTSARPRGLTRPLLAALLALAALAAFTPTASALPPVDVQVQGMASGPGANAPFAPNAAAGQTFLTGRGGYLHAVSLGLYRGFASTYDGDLRVEIHHSNAFGVDAPVLASATIPVTSLDHLDTAAGAQRLIQFSQPPFLAAFDRYVIVVRAVNAHGAVFHSLPYSGREKRCSAPVDAWPICNDGYTAGRIFTHTTYLGDTPGAVDTTAPTVSGSASGPSGANGWFVGGVVVEWLLGDPESGIGSSTGCEERFVGADTVGTTFTCSATNGVGMTTERSLTVKLDMNAPQVVGSVSGIRGDADWWTSNVGVGFNPSDEISGIASTDGCESRQVTEDTAGREFTCVAVNGAGESTTRTLFVRRDASAPVVTPHVSGEEGHGGWHTGDVDVSWDVGDDLSGIASSSGCDDATVTEDTAGPTFTCTARNGAGLSTTKSVTVKRDASAPGVESDVSGEQGDDGWYTGDVDVSWATGDDVSGVASSEGCEDVTVGEDTAGRELTCTVVNGAGLSTTRSVSVKRDASAPAVTPHVSGEEGADGWYTGDVDVSWTVADEQSGADALSGCEDASVTEDTAGTTFTCTARNGAGLQTSESVTLKRDAGAPDVAATVTGEQGDDGWYTGDAAVAWATGDDVSGVASSEGCSDETVAEDTTGRSFTCTVRNAAGLERSETVSVKRDATAPTLSVSHVADGTNGWNVSQPAALDVDADDATSGIADGALACTDDDTALEGLTVSGEGAHAIACSVRDRAGNTASAEDAEQVKIDVTAPALAFTGQSEYTVDQTVDIACAASDGGSGVDADCGRLERAAHELGLGEHAFDASATDRAGNRADGSAPFTVKVTPGSLARLTSQFVRESARYQQLPARFRTRAEALTEAAARQLDVIVPALSPARKAAAIGAYRAGVQVLAFQRYLTAAQAQKLSALAAAL
jgi:hypothetical protein